MNSDIRLLRRFAREVAFLESAAGQREIAQLAHEIAKDADAKKAEREARSAAGAAQLRSASGPVHRGAASLEMILGTAFIR